MINPSVIIQEVENYFYLDKDVLLQYNRTRTIADARAVAMYLVRYFNNYSYQEVANTFKKRDHTSVIHNCKKIVNLLYNKRNDPLSIATMKLVSQFEEYYK